MPTRDGANAYTANLRPIDRAALARLDQGEEPGQPSDAARDNAAATPSPRSIRQTSNDPVLKHIRHGRTGFLPFWDRE
jgi:hypothetical protein